MELIEVVYFNALIHIAGVEVEEVVNDEASLTSKHMIMIIIFVTNPVYSLAVVAKVTPLIRFNRRVRHELTLDPAIAHQVAAHIPDRYEYSVDSVKFIVLNAGLNLALIWLDHL